MGKGGKPHQTLDGGDKFSYLSALLADEPSWSEMPDKSDVEELESSLKSKHFLHRRKPS